MHIIPSLSKGGAERMVLEICLELNKRKDLNLKLITFSGEHSVSYDPCDLNCDFVEASVTPSLSRKWQVNIEALQHAIDSFAPDIIHTHLYESEFVSRFCYYPQAKWFSHAHDFMLPLQPFSLSHLWNKRKLTDYYERRYLLRHYQKNGGTHFIAISAAVEQHLKTILPKSIKINTIPNAVNLEKFKPRKKSDKSDEGLRLISVGRLDTNKNHLFLLKVIREVVNRGYNIHLSILGEGPQRFQLERWICENRLSDHITLFGNQANVEDYLNDSDLYVHAALSEGFGLTMLEAMACGLPIISLDGKGNRELIINGETGYLIPKPDVQLFVSKLIELLDHSKRRKHMARNAYEFSQKFGIDQYVDRLLDLYRSELNNEQKAE